MKMPTLNGNTKVAISVAFAISILIAVFAAGMSWAKVESHAESALIHEPPEKKQARIDSRVELHLRPIKGRLDNIDKTLDRMERALERITEDR